MFNGSNAFLVSVLSIPHSTIQKNIYRQYPKCNNTEDKILNNFAD